MPGLQDYALYTAGYHFSDCVMHFFVKEKMNDWEEMLIHHLTAMALTTSYIYGNCMYIGATISYLHDLTDITSALCKLTNSTIYQGQSVFWFVLNMVIWAWTRLFVLSQLIWFIFFHIYNYLGAEPASGKYFVLTKGVQLSVLLCLHTMWFFMFCRILYTYTQTGKSDDAQEGEVEMFDDKGSRRK